MSLISALNIGKTALAVHQAAIQVASNNIANAGNPDYTRQVARTTPLRDQQIGTGLFAGTGISLTAIQRQIDDALEGRIRLSTSDSESAQVRQEWISRAESIFNELGDSDLSSLMSDFFASWSSLANKPQDLSLRQIVVQAGESVAGAIRDMRSQLSALQEDAATRLSAITSDATGLASQVAELNQQIVAAEGGGQGQANSLRDQRDTVLRRLSELLDIKVQDTGNGMVNVLVGSEPLVLGSVSRDLLVRQDASGDRIVATVVNGEDNGTMRIGSGQVGGLVEAAADIDGVIDQLDAFAGTLIFELNNLHSSGQGLRGSADITATNAVADPSASLASAGLAGTPVNGSFVVHLKDAAGRASSTLVQVDLDGLGGDDTSLEDLRQSLDAIDGLSATISGGRLRLQVDSAGSQVAFSQDSSGVLAALGINAFYTGASALDIAVRADLQQAPELLAAARNGQASDNQTALAIAGLESTALASLGGQSLTSRYDAMINGMAVANSSAKTNLEAALAVKDTLNAQREALSGVSMDEEAINLMREQRAFQGAARVIAAVDELMQTLLTMI